MTHVCIWNLIGSAQIPSAIYMYFLGQENPLTVPDALLLVKSMGGWGWDYNNCTKCWFAGLYVAQKDNYTVIAQAYCTHPIWPLLRPSTYKTFNCFTLKKNPNNALLMDLHNTIILYTG